MIFVKFITKDDVIKIKCKLITFKLDNENIKLDDNSSIVYANSKVLLLNDRISYRKFKISNIVFELLNVVNVDIPSSVDTVTEVEFNTMELDLKYVNTLNFDYFSGCMTGYGIEIEIIK